MKFNSTIFSLVFLNGIKEGFFLILAPFLPQQMDDKQAPKVLFTPLFISYTIWLFIASLVGGKLQGKLGRRLMVRISLILQFSAAISFIALNYIDNVPLFLVVGFAGRTIQGMGAGLLQTAAYSELLIQFPHIQKKLVSLMEFGAVVGGFTGLLFSAFLSYVVGFVGPFAFCGVCFLFFLIFQDHLINFVGAKTLEEAIIEDKILRSKIRITASIIQPQLRQNSVIKSSIVSSVKVQQVDNFIDQAHGQADSQLAFSMKSQNPDQQTLILKDHQKSQKYDKLSYFHILFSTRGFFACLDIMMNLQTFYYNDTILTDNLKKVYDLSPSIISCVYSVQSIGFMLTAIIAPKIVHRFSLVAVVIVAQLIQAGAAFLVGPSELFDIPELLVITIVGFLITGAACPFSVIPPYSELEYCLQDYKDKNFDPEEIQDIVSGVFNSSYALGGITGPLFGGYVCRATDFRTTSDIQGFILIIVASLQLIIVYIPSICKKNTQKDPQSMIKQNSEVKHENELIKSITESYQKQNE